MKLTKKAFNGLAEAIKLEMLMSRELPARKALKQVAHNTADVCEKTNAAFDRERFLRGCGVL